MNKKIRASVVLIKENKILIVKSIYSSKKIIFLLPGGGVEDYETIGDAAIREVKEETNLNIELVKFIMHTQYIHKGKEKDVIEMIFLGKIIQGKETHLNDPSSGNHILNLEWVTYDELCKKEFYPKDFLKILENKSLNEVFFT
jgi:ADP-ribose pyrophosphatase YjhB (NUDIX family)